MSGRSSRWSGNPLATRSSVAARCGAAGSPGDSEYPSDEPRLMIMPLETLLTEEDWFALGKLGRRPYLDEAYASAALPDDWGAIQVRELRIAYLAAEALRHALALVAKSGSTDAAAVRRRMKRAGITAGVFDVERALWFASRRGDLDGQHVRAGMSMPGARPYFRAPSRTTRVLKALRSEVVKRMPEAAERIEKVFLAHREELERVVEQALGEGVE